MSCVCLYHDDVIDKSGVDVGSSNGMTKNVSSHGCAVSGIECTLPALAQRCTGCGYYQRITSCSKG